MKRADVSVVIPCFNDGATLRETIASARGECGELVVVDDGSTDSGTVRVLADLERDGVRILHRSNGGPSAATMAGLDATSRPYVMRLDADDLLEPGALTFLAAALDDTPDAAVAWGDVQTFGLTTFAFPRHPHSTRGS